jgi:hypothetical protein
MSDSIELMELLELVLERVESAIVYIGSDEALYWFLELKCQAEIERGGLDF